MDIKKRCFFSSVGLLEIIIVYFALCMTTISYKSSLYIVVSILLFVFALGLYIGINHVVQITVAVQRWATQMHTINMFAGILLIGLLLKDFQNVHFPGYQKLLLFLFLVTIIICESNYVKVNGWRKWCEPIICIIKKLQNNVGLLCVLFIFGILSIYVGGTPYKWDSRLYYISCHDLNAFSISNLAIYGHIAQTFGLLMKLGTVIFGSVETAALLINIIIAMAAIVAFYGILQCACPKARKIEMTLATGVYAFSPYMLGLVNYLNLDYYCACFFPILIYFTLKNEWIFHVVVAILFCFTKEPAIIIYAGLCLAWFIYHERLKWQEYHSIKINEIFCTPQYWYMGLIGALWLCTYKLLGPWSAGEGGIALDLSYALDKLKVMYLMNFNWIFTFLCIFALICWRYNKSKEYGQILPLVIIPLFVFTTFSCVFKTVNHYRYNDISLFILSIIAMLYILSWKRDLLKRLFLVAICVLMLCSSYLTFDPVSKALFPHISTGKGYILSTSGNGLLGDSSIYNKQMLFLENIVNAAIENGISHDDVILMQAQNNNPWYFDGMMDYDDMSDAITKSELWWDTKNTQRIEVENGNSIPLNIFHVMEAKDILNVLEANLSQQTYSYITLAEGNNTVSKYIRAQYLVIDEKEYSILNWKIKQLRFEMK